MNSCLSISKRRQVVSWKIEFFFRVLQSYSVFKGLLDMSTKSTQPVCNRGHTILCSWPALTNKRKLGRCQRNLCAIYTAKKQNSKTWTRLVSDHPIQSCFWPVWNSQTWFLAVDIFIPISKARIADTNDQCIYDLFFDTYLFSTCWE